MITFDRELALRLVKMRIPLYSVWPDDMSEAEVHTEQDVLGEPECTRFTKKVWLDGQYDELWEEAYKRTVGYNDPGRIFDELVSVFWHLEQGNIAKCGCCGRLRFKDFSGSVAMFAVQLYTSGWRLVRSELHSSGVLECICCRDRSAVMKKAA